MCLFIFRNLQLICDALRRAAEHLLRQISFKDVQSFAMYIARLLLALPALLLGVMAVCMGVSCVAAIKLLAGTAVRISRSMHRYFGVLQAGVQAYQGDATAVPTGLPTLVTERVLVEVPLHVAPGASLRIEIPSGAYEVVVPPAVPPGRSFVAEVTVPSGVPVRDSRLMELLGRCCACCRAEVYCCCLPFYLLSLVFIPFFLALDLACAAVGALCTATRSCCLPPEQILTDLVPSVLVEIQAFDRRSSGVAFGNAAQWRVCTCFALDATSTAVPMGHPVNGTPRELV
jgi:hypothetical protein